MFFLLSLRQMRTNLTDIGNIPVSSATIASLYPAVKTKWSKIEQLEREGDIIRLKRNMFVANPNLTGVRLSMGLIANHLLAPSYVSMSTALRYYGLIPEAVYTIQSMTFKPAKTFNTPVGYFGYSHICREAYPIGLVRIKEGNAAFVMASPEKALCDLVSNAPGVILRFQKEARSFLEEYLRFDMERFRSFDKSILADYAKVGKKASSIITILKLLENE